MRAAPSPATEAYVQRIREVSAASPELLVAHCYTRYLGDLSGGQILKKIAQRAMSLPSDAGVRFYEFNGIPDEGAFKAAYRQRLDALPVDDAMAARIVEEANTVFHLNIAVLEELGRDLSASGSTSLDIRM
jgi:heme oxygenase